MGAPSRLQPVAIAGTGKIKLSILAKPDLPHEEECPTSRLNVASDLVFTLLESDQESKDCLAALYHISTVGGISRCRAPSCDRLFP